MSGYQCMNCMGVYDIGISSICPHCGYDKSGFVNVKNALLPGTKLQSKYIVGNRIKENANVFTYIGWDNSKSIKVIIKEFFPTDYCKRDNGSAALKCLSESKTKFENGKGVFLKRGEEFKKISEEFPNLVEVYDCFEENSTAYIVTQFIEGTTVGEVLESENIPWSSFGKIIRPVIAALAQLHRSKITIQNIDPYNIIVTSDRQVKICDFDCQNDKKVVSSKSVLRQQDSYSAIELYRSGTVITPACDVYSLAAVIYKAITGKAVPSAVERANSDKLVLSLDEVPGIDKNTANALLNALEVEAKNRTQCCQDFYDELFAGKKVERYESGAQIKKGKKTIVAISAVLVVLIAVIIGVFAFASKPGSDDTGKGIATIPDLTGMTYKEAEAKVKELEEELSEKYEIDFKIVKSKETVRDENKKNKGKIALQSPKAGDSIDTEGEIKITVNLYRYEKETIDDRKIEMPDVTNKGKDEAVSILVEAGFAEENIKAIYENGYNESVPAGKIARQNNSAGTMIAANDEIVIYISNGPMPTTVATTQSTSNNKPTQSNNQNVVVNSDDLF